MVSEDLESNHLYDISWCFCVLFKASVPIQFYCVEKSMENSLYMISFCIQAIRVGSAGK